MSEVPITLNVGEPFFKKIASSPDLERVFVDESQPDREFYLPERLDLMVTGKCILRCAGCWGPTHNSVQSEMEPDQWIKIVDYVDANNRSVRYSSSILASDRASVCITGGEPLMYSGLLELTERLSEQDTSVTLSTTGYDPENLLPYIMPRIQEIGIPIDGSNPATNSVWRKGKLEDGGLEPAINALLMAQEEHPGVEATVRTMVHAANVEDIPAIPNLLIQSGIDLSRINWKFYIHNSYTGPRKSDDNMKPSLEKLVDLHSILSEYVSEFKAMTTLVPEMPQDRLIINHDGSSYIILPRKSVGTVDISVGNILTSPTEVQRNINDNHPLFIARACFRAGNMMLLQMLDESKDADGDPVRSTLQRFYLETSQITHD